ncbi:MAG: hypothetical protein M1812_006899 [Candelaria pacifica]|nr:MAG: hypothetical protein M1812_006899 [Candelaria pacifica]
MGTSSDPADYAAPSDWLSDIWSYELQVWLDLYASDLPLDLDLDQNNGFDPSDSAGHSTGACSQAGTTSARTPGRSSCYHSLEASKVFTQQPALGSSVIRGWVPYLPVKSRPEHLCDSVSTSVVPTKQGSRRTGPLDPVKRQKARDCDGETPCKGCVSRLNRIWRSPCSRIQLEDLSEALVPGATLNQYSVPEVQGSVTNSVLQWLDSHVEIDLRWASFAPQFTFNCAFQQFVPVNTKVLGGVETWFGYARKQYEIVPVGSPPIACPHIDLSAFRLRLNRHLDDVLEDHLYTFLKYRFGDRNITYLSTSSRGIVSAAVYHLYTERKQDALLKQAFKLLILIYILSHVIRVDPKSDCVIQPLIQYQEDPKEVSSQGNWFWRVHNLGYSTPTLVNRQIKMIFASMVDPLLRKVLSGLQKAICRGHENDWATAAAVLVILALVTEQLKAYVHVFTVRAGSQPLFGAFTRQSAKAISQAINDSGFGMLLGLYTIRFKAFVASVSTAERSNQSADATVLAFLDRLRSSRSASGT